MKAAGAAFTDPWDTQLLRRFDKKEAQWLIVRNALIPYVPVTSRPESIAVQSAKPWRKPQTSPVSAHIPIARDTPSRRQRPDSLVWLRRA